MQTDKTRESVAELRREIEAIRGDEPPTAAELQVVVDSNTLSLPGRWETSSAVLGSIGEIVRFGLPDDYWSSYAANVRALQLADVDRVARTLITPGELAWVVVGDRARIEADLQELGFDEIREVDADGLPVAGQLASD